MTIKMKITCDRCGFIGYDTSGFHNRHFSRTKHHTNISEGDINNLEFFHLCNKCQEELSKMVIRPKLDLKTIAHSQYAHNPLATIGFGEIPNLYGIFKIYEGVII